MTGSDDDLPIIDAHHHFWDPEKNYHPWLCDEPMIPFRYGDYSWIRTRFLTEEYNELRGSTMTLPQSPWKVNGTNATQSPSRHG